VDTENLKISTEFTCLSIANASRNALLKFRKRVFDLKENEKKKIISFNVTFFKQILC
jgi:hypothetical protein